MENFRLELQRFWDWARLTPDEYKKGLPPKNIELIRHINGRKGIPAEWETDYPYYLSLEKAFISFIQSDTIKEDDNLEIVLQAIAIDNESERLADYVVKYVSSEIFELLLIKALSTKYIDAQWQLISRIVETNIENKRKYVEMYLNNGETEYVRNRAKYLLDNNMLK